MRRLLILVILLILCGSAAVGEDAPRYQALAMTSFHLRREPADEGYRIVKVPAHGRVWVLEWDETWCRVTYRNREGYARTRWLYCFQSMDPLRYPLPVMPWQVSGYVVFQREAPIRAKGFEGTTARPGQMACADLVTSPGACLLPVWRDSRTLAEGEGEVHPFVPWEDAASGDIIGGYTTYYGEHQGGNKAANRQHNIALGCTRIDGTVIEPGGSFSFNRTCGPYLKSNGYLTAPNVSRSHEGYGGGICQVSTTLYNAVLTLPLRIDDWSVHKVRGVSYVPQFFDAAVGKYCDFIFVNTLPYPIRLSAIPQDGILTVLILRD